MKHHFFFTDNDAHSTIIKVDDRPYFSSNTNKVFPAASLIKLPIMLMIFDRFSDQRNVMIDITQRVEGCGVSPYLSVSSYSINDLMTLMIACSDNTATNALIDWLGMDEINQFFQEIGLKDTILNRRMMDIERRKNGFDNFTTADDMMHILDIITGHREFESMFTIMKRQQLKEKVLLYMDDSVEIGTKSGEFDAVRHEVGIMRHNKRILKFALLSEHQNAQLVHQSFHQIGIDFKALMTGQAPDLPRHNAPNSNLS